MDKNELMRRQTTERNNGRLAMLAVLGCIVQDIKFGATPFAFASREGLWGPNVDKIVMDIPICTTTQICALPRDTDGGRAGLTAMRSYGRDAPNYGHRSGFNKPYIMDVLRGTPVRYSPTCPYLEMPEQLEGWVGGDKGFDPLGVSNALPVYLLRECELKHGRVCMLATLGWIATDLGARFPGPFFQKLTTVSAHDACVKKGYFGVFLALIGVIELYSGWLAWKGFFDYRRQGRDAGDFFIGKKFLPDDPVKADDMRLKELENGRLAMLAYAGIATVAGFIAQKQTGFANTPPTWPFF